MRSYQRFVQFDRGAKGANGIPCTISTETPVDRGSFVEVLDHGEGSVDLSRGPLPLIESHDTTRVNVGLVTDLAIFGRTLKGRAVLGESTRAAELLADIQAGIVRNLSVGYQLLDEGKSEGRTQDGRPIVRFMRWMPYEASIVSVPADPRAGFNRQLISERSTPVEDETLDQETGAGENMSRSQRRAAGRTAEAERERCTEINAMAALFIDRYPDAHRMAGEFIANGRSLQEFNAALREKLGNSQPINVASFASQSSQMIGLARKEVQQFSIRRFILGLSDPKIGMREAGFEMECSRAVAKQLGREPRGGFIPMDVLMSDSFYKRDLNVGTPTAGGHLVSTDLLAGSFIDLLRARTVIGRLGATILDGLVGNVAIPRQTGTATTYWLAEGGSPTESQQAIDQVTMSPKTVGAYTEYTRRFMLQSSIAAEMFVRRDLVAAVSIAIDNAAINGTGTSNEPRGILNQSGIGSVAGGTNGAAPTWDHIVDLESAIDNADALAGNLAYLVNPKTRAKLKKTQMFNSTNGDPVWGGDVAAAEGIGVLNQWPAASTTLVPSNLTKGSSSGVCSAIIYGNFTDLLLGMWGALDLLTDPYSLSTSGGTRVTCFADVDIALRHPQSFAAMMDALSG